MTVLKIFKCSQILKVFFFSLTSLIPDLRGFVGEEECFMQVFSDSCL